MPNPLDLQKISGDLEQKSSWAGYFTYKTSTQDQYHLRVFYALDKGGTSERCSTALMLTFQGEQISIQATTVRQLKDHIASMVFKNSDTVWNDIDTWVRALTRSL